MKKLVLPDAVFTAVSALVLFGIVFFITTEPKNSNAVLRALGGRGGGKGRFWTESSKSSNATAKKDKIRTAQKYGVNVGVYYRKFHSV